MVTVYGLMVCPDTVEALRLLREEHVDFVYKDFGEATQHLKEFLAYRDDPKYKHIFDPVRQAGGIGIPLFVTDGGVVTDDVSQIIQEKV